MLVYGDFSFSDLCALTRERRRERLAELLMAERPDNEAVHEAHRRLHGTKRYSLGEDGVCWSTVYRSQTRALKWRKKMWRAGVRNCFYCLCEMSPEIGHPRKVTVDHRTPLAMGGRDDPSNYVCACRMCNDRKGTMTEAEFRRLLASEAVRPEPA